jgi:hypothetical protein
MKRLPFFVILAWACGFPALAENRQGDVVPLSMKDSPVIRDRFRHETTPPEQAPVRCLYDEDTYPIACEPATKAQGAPDKPARAPGAR